MIVFFEVDCIPVRSPHMPRTTSTTLAWRWKYSKLFSRIHWTPTERPFITTRHRPIFDLGDALDIETTAMIVPAVETTEQVQVLPITWPETSTMFSLEEVNCCLDLIMAYDYLAFEKSACFGSESSSIEIETFTSEILPTRRTRK